MRESLVNATMNLMNLSLAQNSNQVSVGISLTQTAIRLITIDSKQTIKTRHEIALPAGVFSQGEIQAEGLSQALKQLIDQANLTSKYVAVTVPEYYSFTRSHTLPSMSLDDVSEALTWQIERILPLPKESVYFDWKLISRTKEELQVLVIAMPRDTLDKFIQIFETVGLKPISFEPSTLVLTRVISLPEDSASIIVEMSPNGSSATLVRNQISYLTVTSQFTSQTQDQVKIALEKTSQSIQSLISYCSNNYPDLMGNMKIYLTGEGASQEISQWFGNILSRPVEMLAIANVPSHFHQAYAAATVEVLPEDRSKHVNLLPDSLRQYYNTTRLYQRVFSNFKFAWIAGAVAIFLSGTGFALAYTQTQRSSVELSQIENQNSTYSYDSQEIVAINQSSQAIVKLFPNKSTPVEKIEKLFSMTSDEIVLTTFSYDRAANQFAITGSASTRKSLLDFVDALKQDPSFIQADLPVEALEKPEDINFNLVIVLANS